MELGERFWAKVRKCDGDGCWEWTGYLNRDGYGRTTVPGDRRLYYAHRLSWAHAHGPIPDGQQVLHSCDNPPCVRPEHLFLGDPGANARDRAAKGRHGRDSAVGTGEANGNARLTEDDVRAIRASARTAGALADDYGVKPVTVRAIRARHIWKHVA